MKYIDSKKLIAEIERLYDIAREASYNGEVEGEMTAYDKILSFITSLQQEQHDCIWIHKKYNREYRIVSDNARLKNSNGEWIDCVIYAPLYENEFEMFAREKDSFYKEFEKK